MKTGIFASLLDVKDHTFAVDISHLEAAQLGPAPTGRIQRHGHRSMHEVSGAIDQPRDLFLAQHARQALVMLRERDGIGR
jgi:hypothetical protein